MVLQIHVKGDTERSLLLQLEVIHLPSLGAHAVLCPTPL